MDEGLHMILVTGATGSIGSHLVRKLQELQVPFKALVRDPGKGRALGCPYVVGDFDDPGSVAAALVGVDQVLLNGGGAVPTADGMPQPMVAQQKTVIDLAVRAGVGSIVKVSVWHAHRGGKLAEGAHWEIEQHLKAAGLEWTLLQPSGFMQNFITGAGTFSDDGSLIAPATDAPVSYIDCYDIAACAAALLAEPRGAGRTFVLTGPEALTMSEVAGHLSTALGRPVDVIGLDGDDMAARLRAQGVPARFAADVAVLWAEVGAGSLAATTHEVKHLTGREPRTFTEFLTANRSAFG
ncbi:NmrA family NAD(P)-binding protein [Streptomyces sp. ITFR-16]|uniref:NmrA family NAD(P)-binding protein n=1 Tax=Streptomyces sp. ITFR-16 TaxID=3075198 RepID=UPI00288B97C3|nr:NmrA family NAD(P)-binding protein [Streptomyces sp. ITFR-16]WNI23661.1 NmrA family NAD(P)-binding protein [Streptomyces sp. ITFR-16]